jgi:hypothetical protein
VNNQDTNTAGHLFITDIVLFLSGKNYRFRLCHRLKDDGNPAIKLLFKNCKCWTQIHKTQGIKLPCGKILSFNDIYRAIHDKIERIYKKQWTDNNQYEA